MARFARVLTRVLPALLLALEATPSFAATELRSPTRRGAVVAAIEPTGLAAPLQGAVPDEPPGSQLVTFVVVPRVFPRAKVVRIAEAHRRVSHRLEQAWLQVHRQRAPSPDDPDPF